ncbi:MAG: T9SS type A sorting domain-containing protein, partial [Candidatus Marinimicrobia bacterium]|nr:T9SS type A sorting domain-containing protein [Candidatus Neomarinimicrobiota bacterium]
GRESGGIIDPRPATTGPAYENVDTVPSDDFFTQTNFKGAFGSYNWMSGYSWLAENGRLGHVATDEQFATKLPSSSRLLGNYPNPFNPSTQIRFELSAPASVRLSVYDVTGRLVSEMNMGNLEQGIQQIRWSTQSASSSQVTTGLYIYQINTGNEVLTGKMLLLK